MRVVITDFGVLIAVVTGFLSGFLSSSLSAQNSQQFYGSGGFRFVAALPPVESVYLERSTGVPHRLFVTAQYDANVRILGPGPGAKSSFFLHAGEYREIQIAPSAIHSSAGTIASNGIILESDAPINVSVMNFWRANTEVADLPPVSQWGTSYIVTSTVQDVYLDGGDLHDMPSQLVIVASQDSTIVTVTSPVALEGGSDIPQTSAGGAVRFMLNSGQTILLRPRTQNNPTDLASTDMTGALVSATKPIGVLAGHQKGSIDRFPYDLFYGMGFTAVSTRNSFFDPLRPMTFSGTTFVTAPLRSPTRNWARAASLFGMDAVYGDYVKFTAIDAPITISFDDGNGQRNLVTLQRRGQSYVAGTVDRPTVWTGTGRFHAVQFLKSYGDDDAPFAAPGSGVAAHPDWIIGTPARVDLFPAERWARAASFTVPTGLPSRLAIVVPADYATHIFLNGRSLLSAVGSVGQRIGQSSFLTLNGSVAPGPIVVTTTHDSARFQIVYYGTSDDYNKADGAKDMGEVHSYAAVTGAESFTPCDDTVNISVVDSCFDARVHFASTASCEAERGIIVVVDSSNVRITTRSTQTGHVVLVSPVQIGKSGSAKLRWIRANGRYVDTVITRVGSGLQISPTTIQLGRVVVGETSTFSVKVHNPMDHPVTITDVTSVSTVNVTSDDIPLHIPQRDSAQFTIRLTIPTSLRSVNLRVHYDCGYEDVKVQWEVGTKSIVVGDMTWTNIDVRSPGVERTVTIQNVGSMPVTVTDYDRLALAGSPNFFAIKDLDDRLPFVMQPGQSTTFRISYSPMGDARPEGHELRLPFFTDATGIDTISILKGNGVTKAINFQGHSWYVRVIDRYQQQQNITQYDGRIAIRSNEDVTIESITVDGNDARYFELSIPPSQLRAGVSLELPVAFRPIELPNRVAERSDYLARVVLVTRSGDRFDTTTADLTAVAVQPHARSRHADLGTHMVNSGLVRDTVYLINSHIDQVQSIYGSSHGTDTLIVQDIRISASPALNIESTWLTQLRQLPVAIAPGDSLAIPVELSTTVAGTFLATWELLSDAPYDVSYNVTGIVTDAQAESILLDSTELRTYVFTSINGSVQLANRSTSNRLVQLRLRGTDSQVFSVDTTQMLSVLANSTLDIAVRFSPTSVTETSPGQQLGVRLPSRLGQPYEAFIEVLDENGIVLVTGRVRGHATYLHGVVQLQAPDTVAVGNVFPVIVTLGKQPDDIRDGVWSSIALTVQFDSTMSIPIEDVWKPSPATLASSMFEVRHESGRIHVDMFDTTASDILGAGDTLGTLYFKSLAGIPTSGAVNFSARFAVEGVRNDRDMMAGRYVLLDGSIAETMTLLDCAPSRRLVRFVLPNAVTVSRTSVGDVTVSVRADNARQLTIRCIDILGRTVDERIVEGPESTYVLDDVGTGPIYAYVVGVRELTTQRRP
ncbi:MAG TPA: hypothetical protein PLW14_03690 [Chlorobiota bacterium]|nr:hypothetical protein [Chlorobiota bacterium]